MSRFIEDADTGVGLVIRKKSDEIGKLFIAKYDPDQPRDEQGRWAAVGGLSMSRTLKVTNQDLLKRMTDKGILTADCKAVDTFTEKYGDEISADAMRSMLVNNWQYVLSLETNPLKEGYMQTDKATSDELAKLADQVVSGMNSNIVNASQDAVKAEAMQAFLEAGMSEADAKANAYETLVTVQTAVNLQNDYNKFVGLQEMSKAVLADKFFANNDRAIQRANAVIRNVNQMQQNIVDNKAILADGVPTIAIDDSSFNQVLSDGRFMSQFEVSNSKGWYAPDLRQTFEASNISTPMQTSASLRPIYGYLTLPNDGKDYPNSNTQVGRYALTNPNVDQYGGVRVVLNSDVRDRTTYTLADSLNGQLLAQPISASDTNSQVLAGITADANDFGQSYRTYTETQVHGGVSMKDVASIALTNASQMDASSLRSRLDSMGYKNIPVVDLRKK